MFKPLSFDLEETAKLFRQKRTLELRGLSNRLIKEASMENDFAKAELGVIAYSLHKIETKQHFLENKNWQKLKKIVASDLEHSVFAADSNNKKILLSKLKNIIKKINSIDLKLGHFAQSIYEKAKVKQASLAYSYGLSISQSAELTGADKKELQSYIGFTTMHDEEPEYKNLSKRVSELKNLFGGK
jgi:hypothetical protein